MTAAGREYICNKAAIPFLKLLRDLLEANKKNPGIIANIFNIYHELTLSDSVCDILYKEGVLETVMIAMEAFVDPTGLTQDGLRVGIGGCGVIRNMCLQRNGQYRMSRLQCLLHCLCE